MRRGSVILVAVATAAAMAGCGAPDELDSDDDRALAAARAELDDALDTEETIRTSEAVARSLQLKVGAASGANDVERVEQLVPSLVRDGKIDRRASHAFVLYAASDAPRALLLPAERAVDEMVEVVDDSGADEDTTIPNADDLSMGRYLDEVERDIRDVWPGLAQQLDEAL